MGSCLDLREYHDSEKTHDAFSKLVSGKQFYKAAIETKKENKTCPNCKIILKGNEKFCPECGYKISSIP